MSERGQLNALNEVFGVSRAQVAGNEDIVCEDDSNLPVLPPGPHRTHKPLTSCLTKASKMVNRNLNHVFGTFGMDTKAVPVPVKKTLRFTPDTAPGVEADVAISITRHRIKDNKYIEYTVVVHQKGYAVHAITKRYKQFEALNSDLKALGKNVEMPPMPTKRWFKTNKWDDDYHMERRFSLQQYLRIIIKLFVGCSKLREFLELKPDVAPLPTGLKLPHHPQSTSNAILSGAGSVTVPTSSALDSAGLVKSGKNIGAVGTQPPLKIVVDPNGTIKHGSTGGTIGRTTSTDKLASMPPASHAIASDAGNLVHSGANIGSIGKKPPLKVSAEMIEIVKNGGVLGLASHPPTVPGKGIVTSVKEASGISSKATVNTVGGSLRGVNVAQLTAPVANLHKPAVELTESTTNTSASANARAQISVMSTLSPAPLPAAQQSDIQDNNIEQKMAARLKQIALEDSIEKGSSATISSSRSKAVKSPKITVNTNEDDDEDRSEYSGDYIDRVDGLSSSPAVRSSYLSSSNIGQSFTRLRNEDMMMLSQLNESICIGRTGSESADRDSAVDGSQLSSSVDRLKAAGLDVHDIQSDTPSTARMRQDRVLDEASDED